MRPAAAATLAMVSLAPAALAQWTVVDLTPPGVQQARVNAVDADLLGGRCDEGLSPHAFRWAGSAADPLDLHIAPAPASSVHAVSGRFAFGEALSAAVMWDVVTGDHTWLRPAGADGPSTIRAAWGAQQVGEAEFLGAPHAGLWRGSAQSWIDLHPPGARESSAYAACNGRQGGYFIHPVDLAPHAALWSGSADSCIDLSGGLGRRSAVYGMDELQQVGVMFFAAAFANHAALWRGSDDTLVDLNPAGARASEARAVAGGLQIGSATWGADVHDAMAWRGSAASAFDLGQFRRYPYTGYCRADAIWTDGRRIIIAGSSAIALTNRTAAILWINDVCDAPSVTTPPADVSVCPDGTASFSLAASGSSPRTFRWQVESPAQPGTWLDLADGPVILPFPEGPRLIGAVTGAAFPSLDLRLFSDPALSAARLRCRIANDCGSALSEPARLSVCRADANCDGFVDFFDYSAFVAAFETGAPSADFNADGFADFFDYLDFVAALEAGC